MRHTRAPGQPGHVFFWSRPLRNYLGTGVLQIMFFSCIGIKIYVYHNAIRTSNDKISVARRMTPSEVLSREGFRLLYRPSVGKKISETVCSGKRPMRVCGSLKNRE